MLIIFTILAIVLIILGVWLINECCEMTGCLSLLIGIVLLAGSIIGIGFSGNALIQGRHLDEQISMYSEENKVIEQKVADSIDSYLKHELGIVDKIKINPNSSVTIVAAYPELNSSVLITEQIKIYNENTKKIKELKEQKILLGSKRWWLYFGD